MVDEDFGGFAPPAFKAAEALVQLKRTLRDAKGLAQRSGDAFDFKGQAVLQLSSDGAAITARVARSPSRAPQWDTHTLKSSLDVRRFTDEMNKRLARWASGDDD
jgi:hypothetical protein